MTLRACLLFLGAIITLQPADAAPMPATPWKRAEVFAICAGRLSALAEHQRRHSGADAARTDISRAQFDALLEATAPDAFAHGVPVGQLGRWQSGGRSEIAGLLAQAHTNFDAGLARRARGAAEDRISTCEALLLPGV